MPLDDATPTRRDVLWGSVAAGVVGSLPRAAWGDDGVSSLPELGEIFKRAGVAGTFVLFDDASTLASAYDVERATRRYVPASTFKMANSLIALETGAVKDEYEIIPYGGKPQPFKAWEKDMSMREAIAASNVAIYQELARRIGLETYARWLDLLAYGNRQTGTALETFWLDGPLEISALEQAKFASKLARGTLPVSQRTQAIVRDILLLESGADWKLHGKTGWRFSSTPQLGWWTGWVERGGKVCAFALNMDMAAPEDAKKRIDIGKQALKTLGVLP